LILLSIRPKCLGPPPVGLAPTGSECREVSWYPLILVFNQSLGDVDHTELHWRSGAPEGAGERVTTK